jgi:uncharacterized membrane protein
MLSIVLGFLPWIILAALGEHAFVPALLLSLASAAITTFRQFRKGSPKILDTATLVFFVCVAVGVLGFAWMALATYMSVLVNITLTAIAWGSLAVGTPFTIQYAREQVAPEYWNSPGFMRVNQCITAVWGLDFFLSTLISAYRTFTGDPSLVWKYAWVALSLLAALFTRYFPAWYRARALRLVPQNAPPAAR